MLNAIGSQESNVEPPFAVPGIGGVVRRKRTYRKARSQLLIQVARLGVVVVILGAWQFASGRWLPGYIVSSPTSVASTLSKLLATRSFWKNLAVTSEEWGLGFVTGAVPGIIIGIAFGYLRSVARVFEPFVNAINGVPKIALAPLFLLWLGLGIWSKVAIAAMTVFFLLFYNTYLGTRDISQGLIDALRVMGAGRWDIARRVVVPSLSSPIFAGLQTGVPFALVGVIVGEFVASDQGIGFYILQQTDELNAAGLYSGLIVLVFIVLVAGMFLRMAERPLSRWRGDY